MSIGAFVCEVLLIRYIPNMSAKERDEAINGILADVHKDGVATVDVTDGKVLVFTTWKLNELVSEALAKGTDLVVLYMEDPLKIN